MPWTDSTRRDYAREASRYASDLREEEWALIAPLLPGPKPVGRPRVANLREVVNAILYMASAGCQWRMGLHPRLSADRLSEPHSRLDPLALALPHLRAGRPAYLKQARSG